MFFKIAVITFVYMSLGMGQERCAVLEGFYESFQCTPRCNGTKYSCNESQYKQLYRMDQCIHDGIYYTNGEILPRQVHYGTSQLCTYRCVVSGPGLFGPVFVLTADCVPTDVGPGSPCFDQRLFVADYFHNNFIPVFGQGDECPFRWIYENFPQVESDDCSNSPGSCCSFPGATLRVGRVFMAGENVTCACRCPPYVQCIET
ncbi:hypothetical protein RI129_009520 [Pyrocoelia pectoralis]|uniref:Uncharacterized protein n=1 Tax=Pyrocoelia pectoralis TaxID=417401 RepID=A0AAN7ZJ14_9COLE